MFRNNLRVRLLFMLNLYTSVRLNSSASVLKNRISLCNRTEESLELVPTCFSKVYCYGKLLDTIQMAKMYPDSKTFVDMKMKYEPKQTLQKFEELMQKHADKPSTDVLQEFVKNNFAEPGAEFENWDPVDWTERPRFLDSVRDPDLRQWGSDLNGLWKILGRKMIPDVAKNPELYSIIHVDHPVIIPGGRFREFYYWDSYWIIRGLLYSEMFDTTKGMLKNFLSIVQRYGFVPNGGRIYYSKRSQPPLLAAMVKSYVDYTGDDKFAIDSVKTLEYEFEFWMNNHSHVIDGHCLVAYGDKSSGPRPESYSEDIETGHYLETEDEKQELYSELKAAAESGMDFSSRWFITSNGTNEGMLKDLKTRSIIPVELNAIMFWNAKIIAEFYSKAGDVKKCAEYEAKAQDILKAIEAVLWHEDVGAWLDYDLINNKRRNYFVPTNLSPLWMKCYDITKSEHISERVLKYIENVGIDKYPGGVPNTLLNTGEQWDFPNVWPPMQYILIIGLDNLGTPEAKRLAEKWTKRWVQSNFEAYKSSQHMYEKYNAEIFGGYGGGGEYDVQVGFGWSNGVIIELLTRYGHLLKPAVNDKSNGNIFSSTSKLIGSMLVATLVLPSIRKYIW
ncbi:trehalase isoform X2 [Condylostylus longicornis]|nr:trehalase isoform X2 [Condylostylus longicornis]